MKNRRVLSIGMPVKLSSLQVLLEHAQVERPNDCIVRHYDGQLIIEEPQPTLEENAVAANDA